MSKLSLSDTLVSLRTAHRLTQEEVASHLGITKAAVDNVQSLAHFHSSIA